MKYEITGEFSYTAEEMADKMFGPDGANADDELREAFLAKVHEKEAELEEELGANGLALGYRGCHEVTGGWILLKRDQKVSSGPSFYIP